MSSFERHLIVTGGAYTGGMANQNNSSGPASVEDVAARVEALDRAMHELTDVKNAEWRPRQKATVARRLGRFAAGIQGNALKPPAS